MHGGTKSRETSLAKGLAALVFADPFLKSKRGNACAFYLNFFPSPPFPQHLRLAPHHAEAAPKKDFKVAWSIYAGWMPWGYASDHGIVKKWADKYGLKIEVTGSTTMWNP